MHLQALENAIRLCRGLQELDSEPGGHWGTPAKLPNKFSASLENLLGPWEPNLQYLRTIFRFIWHSERKPNALSTDGATTRLEISRLQSYGVRVYGCLLWNPPERGCGFGRILTLCLPSSSPEVNLVQVHMRRCRWLGWIPRLPLVCRNFRVQDFAFRIPVRPQAKLDIVSWLESCLGCGVLFLRLA